jgi:hypothetical protein
VTPIASTVIATGSKGTWFSTSRNRTDQDLALAHHVPARDEPGDQELEVGREVPGRVLDLEGSTPAYRHMCPPMLLWGQRFQVIWANAHRVLAFVMKVHPCQEDDEGLLPTDASKQ